MKDDLTPGAIAAHQAAPKRLFVRKGKYVDLWMIFGEDDETTYGRAYLTQWGATFAAWRLLRRFRRQGHDDYEPREVR